MNNISSMQGRVQRLCAPHAPLPVATEWHRPLGLAQPETTGLPSRDSRTRLGRKSAIQRACCGNQRLQLAREARPACCGVKIDSEQTRTHTAAPPRDSRRQGHLMFELLDVRLAVAPAPVIDTLRVGGEASQRSCGRRRSAEVAALCDRLSCSLSTGRRTVVAATDWWLWAGRRLTR